MKFRRTVSSVVASVFLVAAVLLVVLQLRLATYGMDKVRSIIRSFLPSGDSAIQIQAEGMESTLMRSLKVNNLSLSVEGKPVAAVSDINISLTLWDVIKLALGKGSRNLAVSINDITITADEKSIDTLLGTLGKTTSEENQEQTSRGQEHKKNPFLEMGISASIRNLSIHADYRGFSLASDGINASAGVGAGLALESAELNIPEIEVSGDALQGRRVAVRDIRASVGSDHVAYISVLAGSYSDIAQISELSAIAQLQDGTVSAALFIKNGFASVPVNDSVIRLSADSTTVSANYGLSDSHAAFTLSVEDIGFSNGEGGMSFDASSIGAEGSYDGKDALSMDMAIGNIRGKAPNAEIDANDLKAEVGLMLGSQSALGQVSLGNAQIVNLTGSPMKRIWTDGSTMDFSYTHQSLSTRFRTAAGGEHDDSLIGKFSFNIDANAQTRDNTKLSVASIAIRDIDAASLADKANIVLDMDEPGNLHASLDAGSSFRMSADYQIASGEALLNVYITDLVPALFRAPYERFLSSVGAIGQETQLNGNMVVSAHATESFADYMRNVHEGDYSRLSFSSPFDLFSDGRISVNTAVGNLAIGASPVSATLTLEATVNESLGEIQTLAVSTGGIRVSYSGTIDLKQLIPDGILSLQKSSDGSSLATLTFSYEKGERQHTFLFESPYLDGGLHGNVNWEDLYDIVVDGVFEASFFPQELHFSAEVFPNPLNITFKGDNLDLDVWMDDGMLLGLGYLDDLEFYPSENMIVRASSALVGSYDTQEHGFAIDLIDFSVLVSDSFEIGFDLSLTDHSFFLSNLRLGNRGEDSIYKGEVDFTFSDIPSLLKLDTSSVRGTVNLLRSNARTALRGAATDNQFYLDFYNRGIGEESLNASLSILGQRENALYATAKLIWGSEGSNEFNFSALYDDKKISLYDSYGKLGNLSIDDINLLVDLGHLTLNGGLNFRNEITGMSMETKTQSGKLTISASGPEVSSGLLQAFVGLDYGFDFRIGLSDITLSDGYTMADTQVDMHMENGLLSLSGSLINGSYNTDSGYLDIEIDEDILFGFKARGYIGDTLDLMISDISFPLPILNQFIGNPTFSFTNGLIEGDVLIQGPLSNPSLYGMVYCQSYEMTLFFLPDQIITAKNVALSLNDHSLLVSRTPMAGYSEADGRYFYGDVAVDIVMQGLGVETFDVSLNINKDTPIDFWLPMLMGNNDFEIRGDVSGYVDFSVNAGRPKLTTDIDVSSMLIDFRFDNTMPQWFYNQKKVPSDMDITMTTGHDVEFYYPEKDNPFINFTFAEDRTVRLMLEDGTFKTDGGIALKTGQVYYFQNDFIIREGSVDLSQRRFAGLENSVPFVLNLTAEITDYDSDGNKVIISMILQNATLDNINPRFTSTPAKSENEILAMLGQSVLASGALDRTLSLSSLARFARTARDALTRVGVIESNKNYSITGTVRNALGLDIFSARSNILSNVIIDALPGELTGRRDISMLARYLDRTSLFAGKYVGDNWFVKVRLMLKADSNVKLSNKVGHFLAKDLILDTEISLDWDTPMGTLSVFTQPRELSVFDILDTIGFSVTKQIQF